LNLDMAGSLCLVAVVYFILLRERDFFSGTLGRGLRMARLLCRTPDPFAANT
jgi:hypothetical protein